MQVRGGTERGTPTNLRVRGGAEEEVGGDLGRQRILRGGHEILEEPGQRGEGEGRDRDRLKRRKGRSRGVLYVT